MPNGEPSDQLADAGAPRTSPRTTAPAPARRFRSTLRADRMASLRTRSGRFPTSKPANCASPSSPSRTSWLTQTADQFAAKQQSSQHFGLGTRHSRSRAVFTARYRFQPARMCLRWGTERRRGCSPKRVQPWLAGCRRWYLSHSGRRLPVRCAGQRRLATKREPSLEHTTCSGSLAQLGRMPQSRRSRR
jgi:hypothetical protein